MKKNFLASLIARLSPDVFKPIPEGILYLLLQNIEREIGGECPWDTSDHCYKGYSGYWYFRCRNNQCPGYKHPLGLISYTSKSDPTSSIDNNFNYSSLTTIVSGLYVPLGTLGAQMQFDFGGWADVGGFGAGDFGGLYFGTNSQGTLTTSGIYVGDKWYVVCKAADQSVGPAIAFSSNVGSYGPVATKGPYSGDHDTVYTIELIDFWGYVQNFNDALLQMCLATCDGVWLDYWGAYFGITRLLATGGYEADNDYKQRILKEITRAKGTKPVILEEAIRYFKSPAVKIVEYCQVHDWDGANPGQNPDGSTGNWANPDGTITKGTDRAGLQPFQFYIYPPVQVSPSAKFVKDGTLLLENGLHRVWTFVGEYGGYGYGYGDFVPLLNIGTLDSVGDQLFIPPSSIGDSCLFGNTTKFSGILFNFLTMGVGGSYVWEYWNGLSWTIVTVKDTTLGLTQDGSVWWKLPKDWTADDGAGIPYNIPNTGTPQYWLRCRVVSVPSVTPIADFIQLSYAGATNRGRYIGTTDTYDPAKRDRNNCYIYSIIDFEKPEWQSGFQEIVDRLKTAGTVCIINPH